MNNEFHFPAPRLPASCLMAALAFLGALWSLSMRAEDEQPLDGAFPGAIATTHFEPTTAVFTNAFPPESLRGLEWRTWTPSESGRYVIWLSGFQVGRSVVVLAGDVENPSRTVVRPQRSIYRDPEGIVTAWGFDAAAGMPHYFGLYQNLDLIGYEPGSLVLQRAPGNDDFANAELVTGEGKVEVGGSTRGATREAREPFWPDGGGGSSVWYRWVAPKSGYARAISNRGDEGTLLLIHHYGWYQVAAYTGDAVSALTQVAFSDRFYSVEGPARTPWFPVVSGTEYKFRVDEEMMRHVRFNFTIETRDSPPFKNPSHDPRILPRSTIRLNETYSADGFRLGNPTFGKFEDHLFWRPPATAVYRVSYRLRPEESINTEPFASVLQETYFGPSSAPPFARTVVPVSSTNHVEFYFKAVEGQLYGFQTGFSYFSPPVPDPPVFVSAISKFGVPYSLEIVKIVGQPNDDFERALSIAGAEADVTSLFSGATANPATDADVIQAGIALRNTVWWKWTAADATPRSLRADGLGIRVVTGTHSPSIASGSNRVEWTPKAGDTYWIRLDSAVDDYEVHTVQLKMVAPPIPPVLTLRSKAGTTVLDLTLAGAAGRKYRLEMSTDLKSWTPAGEAADPSGTTQREITNEGGIGGQYYRAVLIEP